MALDSIGTGDPVGANTGFLSLADTAREVGNVKPIFIQRAIARNVLAARTVNGQVLVDVDDVRNWLKGGAQDLNPASPIITGWFRGDFDVCQQTGEKLASLGRQTLTPEAIAPLAKEQMQGYSFGDRPGVTIRASLSDAQRKYLAQPSTNPAYGNLATEFLAAQLRQAAKKIITNVAGPVSDMTVQLYASPAAYGKITAAALARMATVAAYSQTSVVFIPDDDGQPQRVIVSSNLPMTEIVGIAGSPSLAF